MSKQIRIFLIAIISLLIITSFMVFFLLTINIILKQAEDCGLNDINHIDYEIQKPNFFGDFQKMALIQAEIIPAHIIIVDFNYKLLADTHNMQVDYTGKYISSNLSSAKKQPFAVSFLRSSKTGDLILSLAKVLSTSQGSVIVQLVYTVNKVKKLVIIVAIFGISLFILLTLLVFFLVSFSIKRYQKPIHKLLQHTKNSARGSFSKISVDMGSPELIQLVENFNTLVDRYNLLIESDNRKYSRINTLLSNMHAGILMVDTKNIITLVNPKAEELLNLNKSRLFMDRDESVFEDGIIANILVETRNVNTTRLSREISVLNESNRILDISIQAIFDKYTPYLHSGSLVIIQDVTEIRRLEKLKDEFVSNVSHEFRTPLTVISGFTETLKSWEQLSGDDRKTALNIIEVETVRLKNMISELMILSEIDGEMNSSAKTVIYPSKIAHEVVSTLKFQCDEKKQKVHLLIQENIKPLFGMNTWFRQILFNLYDNAIKYTSDRGKICFELSEKENFLLFEVKDSGPGIPDHEKERIFERFYRVDKSRNSKISGSGLGLAITRQMVLEFSGSIEIVDNLGTGSIFRVIIPLKMGADT